MLIFQQKIYDNLVSGTSSVFTDTGYAGLLGSVEHLSFYAELSGVTGTLPTVTMQLESSADGARWQSQQALPELIAAPLFPGYNLQFFRNTSGNPVSSGVRLRIALGGTAPVAVIRIWSIGLSPAT